MTTATDLRVFHAVTGLGAGCGAVALSWHFVLGGGILDVWSFAWIVSALSIPLLAAVARAQLTRARAPMLSGLGDAILVPLFLGLALGTHLGATIRLHQGVLEAGDMLGAGVLFGLFGGVLLGLGATRSPRTRRLLGYLTALAPIYAAFAFIHAYAVAGAPFRFGTVLGALLLGLLGLWPASALLAPPSPAVTIPGAGDRAPNPG